MARFKDKTKNSNISRRDETHTHRDVKPRGEARFSYSQTYVCEVRGYIGFIFPKCVRREASPLLRYHWFFCVGNKGAAIFCNKRVSSGVHFDVFGLLTGRKCWGSCHHRVLYVEYDDIFQMSNLLPEG